jgi:integrase
VDAPPIKRTEMQTLTPEQAKILMDAAKGDRLEALYVVAVTTGVRLGEMLALRWANVDLDRSVLHVRENLERAEHGMRIGTPKTEKSRRRIVLRSVAVTALREHRERQLGERLKAGALWRDQDLVFPSTVGTPSDPLRILKHEFKPMLERANLPRIRMHDLRHTAATLMRRAGVSIEVVSQVLGHADASTTMRIYPHVQEDMQAKELVALDRLLGT